MAFLQKLKIDWKNTHKLIIHTLCLRIIEHFQQWPLKAWQLQTTISGSGNISAFTRRGIGGV
jgi:hypothetical protein